GVLVNRTEGERCLVLTRQTRQGRLTGVPTREPSSPLSSGVRSCPLSALPVRAHFRSQTQSALLRLFHTPRLVKETPTSL
ncbi:hypothetical protein QQF64_027863, partial [Cirrhinus molitorella]